MLSVDEAIDLVLARAQALAPRATALADADGLVLAEDVASPIDSPPYDKSIVDGYAVVAADLQTGEARLAILEEVVAGAVPRVRVERGTATRIMTGAPIPPGADAVVMVERTEHQATANAHHLGNVFIRDAAVREGRNILRRGTSLRAGDVVLRSGVSLRAIEVGLLAEVGRAVVSAVPRPRVAILSTGNELVEVDQTPGTGQIRNSNGPLLAAAVRTAGGDPLLLGIARDTEEDLRGKIAHGLQADVLILSGGVSAGVLDLVPRILSEQGVEEVFHKLRLKPGKPAWFGVAQRDGHHALVFGLPGNPVSSYVCCELFVRPALERLAGRAGHGLRRVSAEIDNDFQQRGDRHTFLPALYQLADNGQPHAQAVSWHGSADLRGLAAANALLSFPPGDRLYRAGEVVEILLLDPLQS